jgi:hypothetical protein
MIRECICDPTSALERPSLLTQEAQVQVAVAALHRLDIRRELYVHLSRVGVGPNVSMHISQRAVTSAAT